MPTIEDTAVSIGSAACLVQNLGPDPLYVGDESVTTATGVRIGPGQAVSISASYATNASTYIISSGESDARVVDRGTGIFSVETEPAP